MKKNTKVIIGIVAGSVAAICIVLCIFGIQTTTKKSPAVSDVFTLKERFTAFYQADLNVPSIEISSYAKMCELDFVATPIKRSVEESIEKIKEMSETYPELSVVIENADIYPDEILKSLAGNPEMVHFSINYLNSDGSIAGGFTADEKPEDYPLFLQWDVRWGYMPYGSEGVLGSSGCGPACLAMAVYYLTGNTECTPDAIAEYSLENNFYIDRVGTVWELLDVYPTLYDLSVTHPRLSEKNLKAALDEGNILICSVRGGNFTAEGHFIVIYGYNENGFKINDPKCVYRSRQTWSYDQIKDDIKRTWSIGK